MFPLDKLIQFFSQMSFCQPDVCVHIYRNTHTRERYLHGIIWRGRGGGESWPGGDAEWLKIHIRWWSQFRQSQGNVPFHGCCRSDLSSPA